MCRVPGKAETGCGYSAIAVSCSYPSYFAVCYFEYIYFYWAYDYFGTVRHMSERDTTLFTTVLFIAWTLMTPIGGWISDRLVARYGKARGRRIVPVVALLLSGGLLVGGINLATTAAVGIVLALSMGFALAAPHSCHRRARRLEGGLYCASAFVMASVLRAWN